MTSSIKKPSECNAQELGSFEAMVREGDEVISLGLSQRIQNAAFLMFLFDEDNSLIGVSALKRPNPGYREYAFTRAG